MRLPRGMQRHERKCWGTAAPGARLAPGAVARARLTYPRALGQWPEEFQIEADRAVRSEYWTTGEIIKQKRRNDKRLNDPYLSL